MLSAAYLGVSFRMELDDSKDWKGLLLLWFDRAIDENDLDDESRSPWFTVEKNGLEFYVGYEKGRDWLDLLVSATNFKHCNVVLAEALEFESESARLLDADVRAILDSGWIEKHYFFLESVPWMRRTWVGGEKATTYTKGGLIALGNLALLGLLALLSRREIVHVEPEHE